MHDCFVAGGIYKNLQGEEYFELMSPSPGGLPYVMVASVRDYFRVMSQNAHLYRLEDDYTLTLVAPSPQAIQWGVKAPERVHPQEDLLIKLQAVIEQSSH